MIKRQHILVNYSRWRVRVVAKTVVVSTRMVVLNWAFKYAAMELHHHQLENCCYLCQLGSVLSCLDDPSRILKGAEGKRQQNKNRRPSVQLMSWGSTRNKDDDYQSKSLVGPIVMMAIQYRGYGVYYSDRAVTVGVIYRWSWQAMEQWWRWQAGQNQTMPMKFQIPPIASWLKIAEGGDQEKG